MDFINSAMMGFQVAFQPINFMLCLIGVVLGTLVGVLPGLGPVAAMSLLLPVTFNIPPVSAIIVLSGIYYGSMYGGSTTSILVNIPGEATSVITCLDGYQMARQGRAGPALGIAAIGSFIAGTLSIVGLMFIGPFLAAGALRFGPPEYFAVMILGMTILTFLSNGPMWKALLMAAFGLFLSTIGMDNVSGIARLSFNIEELIEGIGMVPVVMGLFGISEVMLNVEGPMERSIFNTKITNLLPNLKDLKASLGPIGRGTLLGFFLGILPGAGAVISTFASYALEKKISKCPEKFGTGMIEGVGRLSHPWGSARPSSN
jgi:putative tricarboxylic transport membrane protein